MLNNLKNLLLRRLAVRGNVTTGRRFHVGPGSVLWAPRKLTIGDDVYVGKWVTLEVDGRIGDGVLFANSVGVVGRSDHDCRQIGATIRNSRWVANHPEALSHDTTIGSDVWIGYGAVVLSGTTIGDSCVIGSGAVVTGDIPPNSIAVGNPARVVGQRFTESELENHWDSLISQGYRILVGRGGARL